MKLKLLPYLNFDGKTGEAMKFYQSVLGGELKIQTFGESGMPAKDEYKDRIMHAELKNDDLTFMASDGNNEHPVKMGDNISMSIVGSETEKLTEWFNKLSEGGKILMPLEKQFWGDTFGMLVDKFDIQWMVNISQGEQAYGK